MTDWSSAGASWTGSFPVLFDHANNPKHPDWDMFGRLELSPETVTLTREGRNLRFETQQRILISVAAGFWVLTCALLKMGCPESVKRALLVVGIVLLIPVVFVVPIARTWRAWGVGTRFRRWKSGIPMSFAPGEAWAIYHKDSSVLLIKRPDGQWLTLTLNRSQCSRPIRQTQEEFQAELAATFGDRFQLQ